MTTQNQVFAILVTAVLLGLLRFAFLDDPEFTLIKKERIIQEVESFSIPKMMTEPMLVNLDFCKYHFDKSSAVFIDARDVEDFENGHIKNSINIPYDYYEDYEELIDSLEDAGVYIIYCSGDECSLSLDLGDYLFNEMLFENIFIFEGGWPQWRDAGYPGNE